MQQRAFLGQSVVVTGASAGIGRKMAFQLAQQGARLGLAARGTEQLERVATESSAFNWVRIYNPFTNWAEYYPWRLFRASWEASDPEYVGSVLRWVPPRRSMQE